MQLYQDTTQSSTCDEIEEEHAEAQMRAKRSKEFDAFVQKIEEISTQSGGGLQFDTLYLLHPSHPLYLFH